MVTWFHTTLTPPCSPGEISPCNLKEVYSTCNKSWSYYIKSKVNQYVQSQSTTEILLQGRRIASLPRVLAIQISLQTHPRVRWDTMRQFVVHHWCWIRDIPKSWVWELLWVRVTAREVQEMDTDFYMLIHKFEYLIMKCNMIHEKTKFH